MQDTLDYWLDQFKGMTEKDRGLEYFDHHDRLQLFELLKELKEYRIG